MIRNLLIDPLNKTSSHLFFNVSVISGIVKTDKTALIGDLSHIEELKPIQPELNYLPYGPSGVLNGIFKSLYILTGKAAFRKRNILFLCFDNTIIPLVLIMLYPVLFRSCLSLIIHNNLTTLKTNKIKRFVYRLMVTVYKANVYVMSKQMKRIYDLDVESINKSILLPHPNYSRLVKFDKAEGLLTDSNKINVIAVGRQAKLIIDFLRDFPLESFTNIRFTIVHREKIKAFESKNVTIINKRLTYDEYYTMLSEANFALFALDNTVEHRASGILMDCISLQCAVIAPCTGHFLEYENMGIGYFYTNYADLKNIFQTINSNPQLDVTGWTEGFKQALSYSAPGNFDRILFNRQK
jgi:hypothetical protein